MKDIILIHRMDESNRIRRMRFVTDEDLHERAEEIFHLLDEAGFSEDDVVLLADGFTVKLTRADIPHVLRVILRGGINVYGVYEVYELYES